ncbi:Katanin p80 WD40 repeat-containing subunit B1 1 [Tetrabaena socialis]|uniref:Katanin p80 WD40 repeat-containing subunit B1 1 n=1 Tax=Tetrabaena socialis TaxID=47790 RepID=A0A2J8A6Z6_9CHLO|nr:Katanin p80 WD40 repeat-containing subunit B1 1 [Tetrabaena socialis]|eukprot:PNH08298.1 Katanin p80 WD40 repeat-containing subunit B1 1 [Tetrabaena socialis]
MPTAGAQQPLALDVNTTVIIIENNVPPRMTNALISAGVLPANRRRMPFMAASRQTLVMPSPLCPSSRAATDSRSTPGATSTLCTRVGIEQLQPLRLPRQRGVDALLQPPPQRLVEVPGGAGGHQHDDLVGRGGLPVGAALAVLVAPAAAADTIELGRGVWDSRKDNGTSASPSEDARARGGCAGRRHKMAQQLGQMRYLKLAEFAAHSGEVRCAQLVCKTAGVLVTGGTDMKVNYWAINKTMPGFSRKASLSGHQSPVESVSLDTEEKVVAAGGADGSITVFDLAAEKARPRGQRGVPGMAPE